MAGVTLLNSETFDPNLWVFDTDLNVYHNTFWRKVIVWVVSFFSNSYDPVHVAEKVASAFENAEVPPPHVEINLCKLKKRLIEQLPSSGGKVRAVFEKITFPRRKVVQPPNLVANYRAALVKKEEERVRQLKSRVPFNVAAAAFALTVNAATKNTRRIIGKTMISEVFSWNCGNSIWRRAFYGCGAIALQKMVPSFSSSINQYPMKIVSENDLFPKVVEPLILVSLLSNYCYLAPVYLFTTMRAVTAGELLPSAIDKDLISYFEGGYLGYLGLRSVLSATSYVPEVFGLVACGAISYKGWRRAHSQPSQ